MNSQTVVHSDCRTFLNNPFCPNFDFIIGDPPFNLNQKYSGYKDKIPADEYRQFTCEWIVAAWNKLRPGAAMVIHASVKASREVLRACFQTNLDTFIETEICWAYNFGQCTFNNFIETHCRAIVLRKPGSIKKWYVEQVLTPSTRLLMGDKRVQTSQYKGMIPYGTVWGLKTQDALVLEPIEGETNWGRVQGNNKERRPNAPNQLPEAYVERLISAYTLPGDKCFVAFAGSGTEIAVCKKMNRSCVATEISKESVDLIQDRINDIEPN